MVPLIHNSNVFLYEMLADIAKHTLVDGQMRLAILMAQAIEMVRDAEALGWQFEPPALSMECLVWL